MQTKIIAGTIYVKDGKVYFDRKQTEGMEPKEAAAALNDSGLDRIICFDLSDSDDEHEKDILAIKELGRALDITLSGGGNIKRLEDVKKLIYAGCHQIIINGSKQGAAGLCAEAASRFGVEKIAVSISNMDFVFKVKKETEQVFSEYVILNQDVLMGIADASDVPYIISTDEVDASKLFGLIDRKNCSGLCSEKFVAAENDVYEIKNNLYVKGALMEGFCTNLSWADLKKNEQGMVPVVVQDYLTDQVLMLAYMNEEAFEATIHTGRMTYYSRSRRDLWIKGETSGHFQFVKSLYADCDKDTILAKVSQIGAACHTGERSCFFNEIIRHPYIEKNPQKVLEEVYATIVDRKANPKEGSYTNYLFDKGIDKILKKVGEECTEIVIAAKNPNPEEIKYEISDFLYHCMVLMVDKGVTWEDISGELSQR